MTKLETRKFTMHPQLLFDVIRRQAGTLGKAILEGVMNSVDAGAPRCDITLTGLQLDLCDSGRGFKDRAEIENFFEVFGQPHTEVENKKYGTFRMGRGQLFAFGHNVWRSGKFLMDVDVWRKGLDYQLQTCEATAQGCSIQITLYNPLMPSDLASTLREIEASVKWVDIPVYLNKKLISQNPAKAKWECEDESCRVSFKESGGLRVYNLGVLVKEYPGSHFGLGGDAVSKTQMKVNFARNEPMSDCPVWTQMQKYIRAQAGKATAKKATLTDSQRTNIVRQMFLGELPNDFHNLRLVPDVNGRNHSIKQLRVASMRYTHYTAAPTGHWAGDRIHQQGIAFVFADLALERFEVETAEELMAAIRKIDAEYVKEQAEYARRYPGSHHPAYRWAYESMESLGRGIDKSHIILKDEELSTNERVHQQLASRMVERLCPHMEQEPRRVVIGASQTANGWTDGKTYIALGRDYLNKQELGTLVGVLAVSGLILHELCHNEADETDHAHPPEFYQLFHDVERSRAYAEAVDTALTRLPQVMQQFSRQLTKRQLKEADRQVRLIAAKTRADRKDAKQHVEVVAETGSTGECDDRQRGSPEGRAQRAVPVRKPEKVQKVPRQSTGASLSDAKAGDLD